MDADGENSYCRHNSAQHRRMFPGSGLYALFQAVAKRHQLIDLSHNPLLLSEGREGDE